MRRRIAIIFLCTYISFEDDIEIICESRHWNLELMMIGGSLDVFDNIGELSVGPDEWLSKVPRAIES